MDEQELALRVRVLRGVDIFSELRKAQLEQLADKVTLIELRADENLITKGDQGHSMYMITEGHVKVHDGSYEFTKLAKGECFGEYALIDPDIRNASITSVGNSKLFELEQDDFYELVDGNPGFINSVLIILIRRLRKIDEVQKSLADSYVEITKQKEKNVEQDMEVSSLSEERELLREIISKKIRKPLETSQEIAREIKQSLSENDSSISQHIDNLTNSLDQISNLINDEFSKSGEKKKEDQPKKNINLGVLVQSVAQKFMTTARKKSILIELDCKSAFAHLDKVKAFQVIENLVSNAITYSPIGNRVFLKAESINGRSIIEVKDQGPGFTEEDKKNLYVKFQRLSAVATAGENCLGLGLATAKELVDELEGEISLESVPGNGATFTVSFNSVEPEN